MNYKRFSSILLWLIAFPAFALELGMPVDCAIGKECFIQNYVDHDSDKGWADYRCGTLSYNKHKGTDFRVPTMKEAQKGIPVIAAADGTIKGIRNNMPDIHYKKLPSRKLLKGRECGNGVVIAHDNGFETQYCHLKQGSITVKQGQKVKKGDFIGHIGLSGMTEFPHLHLSVRKEGEPIDPFTNSGMKSSCNINDTGRSLWSKKAYTQLPYTTTNILKSSFTKNIPTMGSIISGKDDFKKLKESDKNLVFWTLFSGVQTGDILRLRIITPKNIQFAESTQKISKANAQYFIFTGKKIEGKSWSRGTYQGKAELIRSGKIILTKNASLLIQ